MAMTSCHSKGISTVALKAARIPVLIALALFFLAIFAESARSQMCGGGSCVEDPKDYIVEINVPSGESLMSTIQDLASQYNASIGFIYSSAFDGASMTMLPNDAKNMEKESVVVRVERAIPIQLDIYALEEVSQSRGGGLPPWGLDRIDQRTLPLDGIYDADNDGSGVDVYIFDSGIHASHPEFGGRVNNAFTAFGTFDDATGHGTHVAGIIGSESYGVAPGVSMHSIKVFNSSNSTTAELLAGIDYLNSVAAVTSETLVANMSLGFDISGCDSSGSSPECNYLIFQSAISALVNNDVFVVASGGNDGSEACEKLPVAFFNVFGVGSSSIEDKRSTFSNYGECIDLLAPGESIESTWVTSSGQAGTTVLSGTSMAAPHVAGAATLILEGNAYLSSSQIRDELNSNSTIGALVNLDPDNDYMTPNRLLYVDDEPRPVALGTLTSDAPCQIAYGEDSCQVNIEGEADYTWDACIWRNNYGLQSLLGCGNASFPLNVTTALYGESPVSVELLAYDDPVGSSPSYSEGDIVDSKYVYAEILECDAEEDAYEPDGFKPSTPHHGTPNEYYHNFHSETDVDRMQLSCGGVSCLAIYVQKMSIELEPLSPNLEFIFVWGIDGQVMESGEVSAAYTTSEYSPGPDNYLTIYPPEEGLVCGGEYKVKVNCVCRDPDGPPD